MYRHEQNLIICIMAGLGLLSSALMQQDGLLIGLALFLFDWMLCVWTVRKNKHGIRHAQRDGYKALAPLQASPLTRWLVARSAGIAYPHRPAWEYHVQPRISRLGRVAVMRGIMSDLTRIARESPFPSFHCFAWHGVQEQELGRLLDKFRGPHDEVRVWRHRDTACGVVERRDKSAFT